MNEWNAVHLSSFLRKSLFHFIHYSVVKVGEAMQKMQDRKNIGKIILDPTLEPKPKPVSSLFRRDLMLSAIDKLKHALFMS